MGFINNKAVKEISKLFFIGGGILTVILLFVSKNMTTIDFVKMAFLNGFSFAVFGYGNSKLTNWIDKYLPWTGNIPLRVVVSVFATVVYTSIAWVFIAWFYYFVDDGTTLSFFELLKVLPKNRNAFLVSLGITFFVSIILHGRGFLIAWRQSIVEAEQLKKEQIAAKYEVLKNQVNPHFLFNSLNVLTTLVHKDADLAEQFIRQLSHNYRYILDTREREVVSISEEIKNLEAYIFLMKIRFGESLKVEMDIDTDGKIAPLTLQMLVENAFKHNEVSKMHPLSINLFNDNNFIVIKNNIQKKNNVADSTGVGLENIKARYKSLSQEAVVVNDNDGFFVVKVPIV